MDTFEVLLKSSAAAHGHLCPGQVVGVRMGMLGCRLIGLDEPQPWLARDAVLETWGRGPEERMRNYRSAELRRQEPSLDPAQYLAVVDLPLDQGVGQAGIPVSQDASWVRFLIDGVPLPDVELSSRAFHIHAVIQAPGIEADATWSGVAPSSGGAAGALGRAAVDAAPALIDALAAGPHGDTPTAAALIWRYLKSARTSKDRPLESLPPGLVERPLVSTVDRGK